MSCSAAPPPAAPTTPVAKQSTTSPITVDVAAGTVTLQVGQELIVRRPDANRQWMATGAERLLERVAPRGEDPVGPDGWRFRARTAGEDDLAFTGHVTPECPNPPNCPPSPAPPTITLHILVRPAP
jgi:hypothetical protein